MFCIAVAATTFKLQEFHLQKGAAGYTFAILNETKKDA